MACIVDCPIMGLCRDSRRTLTLGTGATHQEFKGSIRMSQPIQSRHQTREISHHHRQLVTPYLDQEQQRRLRVVTLAIRWAEGLVLLSLRQIQTPCRHIQCLYEQD